ncbi:MAG: alpha/beta hydrolase [Candidatus Moraniibacteriota bacterium]
MQKSVYIIHGWEWSPESNWFPWLEKKLRDTGVEAKALAMPNPYHPTLSAWVESIATAVGEADEETFLVGHSLGVIAILRYLETLPDSERIGGAVLVAGFPEPIGIDELGAFFETPLDYEIVRNVGRSFVAIQSDNDPYVPMKNGELLHDRLDAELVVIHDAGHLNASDGYSELPMVLEKLKEMMKP